MAALEQEHGILGPRPRPAIERSVFAADGERRPRLLRLVGLGTAALSLVWLAALGVAMLGGGRLPGVPLSNAQVPRVPDATSKQGSPFEHGSPLERPGRPAAAQSRVPAPLRSETQHPSALAAVRRAPQPVAPPQAADPLPVAPAPAPEPSPSRQGWARRGWATPPGQAKRDDPVPRGRSAHTSTATTTTTVATATAKQGTPQGPKKG